MSSNARVALWNAAGKNTMEIIRIIDIFIGNYAINNQALRLF